MQAFGSFIVSSTLKNPGPATCKFIRSYVMRGKNRRRPRLPVPKASRDPGWITMPSHAVYDQFSLLGFGDDLALYMKNLIYQDTGSKA